MILMPKYITSKLPALYSQENTVRLLRISQRASTPPPELLSSVILATSKLTTYTSGFSNAELLRMLLEAVNRREAPMIAKHLVQSGRRSFLRS